MAIETIDRGIPGTEKTSIGQLEYRLLESGNIAVLVELDGIYYLLGIIAPGQQVFTLNTENPRISPQLEPSLLPTTSEFQELEVCGAQGKRTSEYFQLYHYQV